MAVLLVGLLVVPMLAGCFSTAPSGDANGPPASEAEGDLPAPLDVSGHVAGVGEFVRVFCGETANCPVHPFVLERPALVTARLSWTDAQNDLSLDLTKGDTVISRSFKDAGASHSLMQRIVGAGEFGFRIVPFRIVVGEDYRLHVEFEEIVTSPDGPVRGLDHPDVNAIEERDDGSLWFTFEHRPGDPMTLRVPTNEYTAAVALSLDIPFVGPVGTEPVQLLDEDGLIQCSFHTFREPYACIAPDAGADVGEWQVVLSSDAEDLAPYDVHVGLLNNSAIKHADPTTYTDSSIRFADAPTGGVGGEPSIGVLSDGGVFVQQGLQTVRSDDQGATWTDVTPAVWREAATLDPLLRADPWRGHVWISHLTVACSYLARSDDAGATWVENPVACGVPVVDHQKVASGPHPAGLDEPAVYHASASFADIGTVFVSRSWDGGITWQPSSLHSESTITDDVTGAEILRNMGYIVADEDGYVYTASYRCQDGIVVGRSADHGLTFTFDLVRTPPLNCNAADLGLAVDVAGNVYVAFESGQRVHFVVSTDHGASWSPAVPVSPPEIGSVIHITMTAGDDGRIAIAYLGTPDGIEGPNHVPGFAHWHVYVTYVLDATEAPEIATALASPRDDPVQVGTICTWGMACTTHRNLLDFIGSATGPDGRVYVAYADGCLQVCPSPSDSTLNLVHVAVQETGPRLFEGGAPWAA